MLAAMNTIRTANSGFLDASAAIGLIFRAGEYANAMRPAEATDGPEPDLPEDKP
jgi:hypothetical protein